MSVKPTIAGMRVNPLPRPPPLPLTLQGNPEHTWLISIFRALFSLHHPKARELNSAWGEEKESVSYP